jgi:XTP/dITP diphosphohydrolase
LRSFVPILVATSNAGKLRDFAAAASLSNIEVRPLPNFKTLPAVEEDGLSFEANARKKAEFYSRFAPGEVVLADDSGLEVDALQGSPGVRSARYASDAGFSLAGSPEEIDAANNRRLLQELEQFGGPSRSARFVCVIAAARDGATLETFDGEVRGEILSAPRGTEGFGYDPLFLVPALRKTLAELSPEQKAAISHRGAAFRKFLEWMTPK